MMNRLIILIAIACLPASILFAQQETWITNVNLVDPARKTIQPNMTVVVKNNLVTAIHRSKAPGNVAVIDAAGKYLLPGLTDAHVHFFQSGGLYTRPDMIDLRRIKPYSDEIKEIHAGLGDQLRRYIQNGITTVFDVGATYHLLNHIKTFTGSNVTPEVHMAGPIITTGLIPTYDSLQDDTPFMLAATAEDGRRLVQEQLKYHPDLIKLIFLLDDQPAVSHKPVVTAVIEEAHRHGLRVAVHAVGKERAQLAVEAGANFLVHSVENEEIDDAFVALLKKKKVVLCPTLTIESGYQYTFDQSRKFTTHELIYAEPFALGSLYDLKQLPDTVLAQQYKLKSLARAAPNAAKVNIRAKNLKKLSDAGVTIVSGSDAGNIGTLHAVSLLPELLEMQRSGMNTWQVLQAATIHPAAILDRSGYTGNIGVGQPANMVLLNGDPVADLHQLEHIQLVVRNGHVIAPDTLIHQSPEALVQRQLNAYNSRNMEAFLNTYSDDAALYDFPGKLLRHGKEDLRKAYFFFDLARLLHCRIDKRIVEGNFVIDKEHILDDHGTRGGTAIYQVENGKIRKVFFIE
ncbi:MAG: amidohydrolase family protein [Chitinophaga sp.]|uniref:amidohydrolase family protein n=1 Tax=Chitinophaga sp. TaxID=1869181 RepID=UPI001B05475C|nr:amidohydrolase family protein [Chitinophaga sp.]MBO9730165.1 amidohydrolase family protein [Chitinophaga sp.]